jgi:hypothetical protein
MRILKTSHLLVPVCGLMALSACETVGEEMTEAVGFEYTATLTAGAGGTGTGKAEVSLNDATNTVCTDLELSNVGTVSAAHLVGPGGALIKNIDAPDDNDSEDCDTTTDAVIDGIRANPGGYMIHVAASTGDLTGTLRKE